MERKQLYDWLIGLCDATPERGMMARVTYLPTGEAITTNIKIYLAGNIISSLEAFPDDYFPYDSKDWKIERCHQSDNPKSMEEYLASGIWTEVHWKPVNRMNKP